LRKQHRFKASSEKDDKNMFVELNRLTQVTIQKLLTFIMITELF